MPTARYRQNQGLMDALGQFQQQNAAVAARPPMPSYASRQMASYSPGLMGNYGAPYPTAQPGYQQGVAHDQGIARQGNYYNSQLPGYAPMGTGGLQQAPQGLAGYNQQMQVQNPGGRFYGGALPTMIAGAGGSRPGYMAPPAQTTGGTINNAQFASQHGLYHNPQTGAIGGNPNLMYMNPAQVATAGVLGRGPGQSYLNIADAQKGRETAQQGLLGRQGVARQQTLARVGIRANNAAQAQQQALAAQQQQQMMGLMAFNPALGMQMAAMNQRGQIAQQQFGLQNAQLAQQGRMGMQQSSDRRYVADQGLLASQHNAWANRYGAAIKAGNTPDDAAKLAGPPPAGGLTGQPGAPAQAGGLLGAPAAGGYKPKKQLLDAQISAIASAPAGKREAMLRGMGVTDQTDIYNYMKQIDPTHGQQPLGFFDQPKGGPGILGAIFRHPTATTRRDAVVNTWNEAMAGLGGLIPNVRGLRPWGH